MQQPNNIKYLEINLTKDTQGTYTEKYKASLIERKSRRPK